MPANCAAGQDAKAEELTLLSFGLQYVGYSDRVLGL
jgi:hypothetical protein